MRPMIFVLLLTATWSTAGACQESPKKIDPIDVASVESTTILTSEQIAKIHVPRDLAVFDCWGRSARQAKRECSGNLPIEECPTTVASAGL
jgi:hypothetical protein